MRAEPLAPDQQPAELRAAPPGLRGSNWPERGGSGAAARAARNTGRRRRSRGVGGLAAPTLGRGRGRNRAGKVEPKRARCEGADSSRRAAAEAPRGSRPYLSFPDPAQSSGLGPAEVSQPSALRRARRHRSPGRPGSRTPRRPPGRRRPRAGTRSDRSLLRSSRGGAGGGRARARAPGRSGESGEGGGGCGLAGAWAAPASREQAARPPECRTADKTSGPCGPKFAKKGFPEVNTDEG